MDAFALFGMARRPLIDQARLKERYLRLAADQHPDASRGESENFHLVQEAYQTLREPSARLRHLVELEFPGYRRRGGSVPDAKLFLQAGGAVQEARAVSQRLESARSGLARALLSPEIAAALRQMRETSTAVQNANEELDRRLSDLDARWPDVSPEELSALSSSFTFLTRWKAQLSEWEFRLSHG